MSYKDTSARLEEYRRQIADLRRKMREAQAAIEPEEVTDYAFRRVGGTVKLSELFGDQDTLFVVHNMGASCPNCTLWADGFNGAYDHLRSRAAFVVSSPDPPEKQQAFAASRGWRFPMVSVEGTSFAEDMGYWQDDRAMPGISVFRREGGKIMRVADTSFEPGDDFCTVWHVFDLIPEGVDGWKPKFRYAS
jgi:predicted dithiol-disulfide oxidoreductase (DUF899 family)